MVLERAEGDEMAVQLEGRLAVADDLLGAGRCFQDLRAQLFQRCPLFWRKAREPVVEILRYRNTAHRHRPTPCLRSFNDAGRTAAQRSGQDNERGRTERLPGRDIP